jgi:hypothetical protein
MDTYIFKHSIIGSVKISSNNVISFLIYSNGEKSEITISLNNEELNSFIIDYNEHYNLGKKIEISNIDIDIDDYNCKINNIIYNILGLLKINKLKKKINN